jgi:hypothetical protein
MHTAVKWVSTPTSYSRRPSSKLARPNIVTSKETEFKKNYGTDYMMYTAQPYSVNFGATIKNI